MAAGRQHRRCLHNRAVGGDHFAGKHFRASLRTEPGAELVGHHPAVHPQPGRAEAVPHR